LKECTAWKDDVAAPLDDASDFSHLLSLAQDLVCSKSMQIDRRK